MLDALRNPKKALIELDRLDCEESLSKFLKHAWRFIDPAPYVHGWHLDAISEHLEAVTRGDITRLIVNVPPRHSKSTIVSVAWPVWTWAQRNTGPLSGPQVQFLSASYAQPLSTRDALKSRRLIQSKWFQERWGHQFSLTGDQNAKMRYENDKGGYRIATSVDGAATGEGGQVILIDDPLNAKEALSEAELNACIEWWDGSMSTRLNDPNTGAYVIIMQRLAEDDLTGHALADNHGNWTHLCLPARYESDRHCVTVLGFDEDNQEVLWEDPRTVDGELLAPERFNEHALNMLERQLGPYRASGQLQQRPSPKGGGILKREYWQPWNEDIAKRYSCVVLATDKDGNALYDRDTGKQAVRLKFPNLEYIVASMDTAYTEKEENDYSAMTVWGIWNDMYGLPKVMLLTAWHERLALHDLVEKAALTCRKFKVDRMLIESKASGISVAQEIQRLHKGENWSVQLVDPGNKDKVARAHAISPTFSEEQVYAPADDEILWKPWVEMVVAECEQFPKGTYKDLVDTVTQAIKHLRDGGALMHGSELAEELAGNLAYRPMNAKPLYPS